MYFTPLEWVGPIFRTFQPPGPARRFAMTRSLPDHRTTTARDPANTNGPPALTQLIAWQASLMSQDRFGPAGIQLVSDLATSFGCAQVALGWWQRQRWLLC